MPDRISDCACYDVFTVKDGEQIFLAAVSDAQWTTFCHALGFTDMLSRPELATNNDRVRVRSTLLPELRARLANHSAAELSAIFETNGLPRSEEHPSELQSLMRTTYDVFCLQKKN